MDKLQFKPIAVRSWEALLTQYSKLAKRHFVFRGQITTNNSPKLSTSFERALCAADNKRDL